jgi:colanic acid/amylovoran biosynthesis glycosyltransferase
MTPSHGQQKVCIWREDLLPGSETFIMNQARSLRRWHAVLSGIRTCPGALDCRPDFTLQGSFRPGERLDRWIYRRTGTSPRLHRHLRHSDVVHAHFGPDGVRIARAARVARRPLVVTFHGYDVTIAAALLGVDYTTLFSQSAVLLAVSGFIRSKLLQAGAPEEKVKVLPIGIPVPPKVRPEGGGEHVLFVGRLVPKKGCADLLEALAELHDAPPLVVIGDGPLRGDLENRARRLRVNASFVGMRGSDYVARAMARSIAVSVPSKTSPDGDQEGLGMVFLEAAAASRPVVSYASGGVPEAVVHGETGLLAPEGDVKALAGHLQRVTADADLAARLGASARRRVEVEFDIDKRAAQLEAVYDAVVDGHKNDNRRPV